NEINFLRETEEMMRLQHGLVPSGSHYSSDWPRPGALHQLTGASRSLPSLPTTEMELEASLHRVFRQQDLNRESLNTYLRALPTQASESPWQREGRMSESGFSSEAATASGTTTADSSCSDATSGHLQQQPQLLLYQGRQNLTSISSYASSNSPSSSSVFAVTPPSGGAVDYTGVPSDQDRHFFPATPTRPSSLFEEDGQLGSVDNSRSSYGVLECSLSGVRDLTEGLFQLRESQLHTRLVLRVGLTKRF
ncbi:hypothetical protein ElyMa_004137500, partial [Elysia marginata]